MPRREFRHAREAALYQGAWSALPARITNIVVAQHLVAPHPRVSAWPDAALHAERVPPPVGKSRSCRPDDGIQQAHTVTEERKPRWDDGQGARAATHPPFPLRSGLPFDVRGCVRVSRDNQSMVSRRPAVSLKIKLPGVEIGLDGIDGVFGSRKRRGPFVIISRDRGMALDTDGRRGNGTPVVVRRTNAGNSQFWYLEPSGHAGEIRIISADNRLALDATRPGDIGKPILWEWHGPPWQRWTLTSTPDGAAFVIGSVGHDRVLAMTQDAEPGWQPWLEERRGVESQHWVLALPHGALK